MNRFQYVHDARLDAQNSKESSQIENLSISPNVTTVSRETKK